METSRLAAIPLFADLDAAELLALSGAASEVELGEGETLASEGDFGHSMFVIESGIVEVTVDGTFVATLGPGDLFGEMAVLASGRRVASGVAKSPLQLIAFFKRDVWALGQRQPEVAERLRTLIAERRAVLAELAE